MRFTLRTLCLVTSLAIVSVAAQDKKPLQVEDIMKFKAIRTPVLSEDGRWLAFEARPDRGDGEVRIHSTDGRNLHVVARGSQPVLSKDSRWAAMLLQPTLAEREKKDAKSKARTGLALTSLSDGATRESAHVKSFAFSDDSAWMAALSFPPKKPQAKKKDEEERKSEAKKSKDSKKDLGAELTLHSLKDDRRFRIPYVRSFAFSPDSRFLVYDRADETGQDNGLLARDLAKPKQEMKLDTLSQGRYSHLTFARHGAHLAAIRAQDNLKGKPGPGSLLLWEGSGKAGTTLTGGEVPQDWMIPSKNDLAWSRDGRRLFLGLRPRMEAEAETTKSPTQSNGDGDPEADAKTEDDPYDVDALLKKRELDVWHWEDPRIIPNQKKLWKREKDRTYTAVFHLDSGKLTQLADLDVPSLRRPLGGEAEKALLTTDVPYRRDSVWDQRYNDFYLVDLRSGKRTLAAQRVPSRATPSPSGRYLAYFLDDHWHLFDSETGQTVNLTKGVRTAFYDEDHDYPSSRRSYGLAGWIEGDRGLLLYDRYDVWRFSPQGPPGQPAMCLTAGQGRRSGRRLRVVQLDPDVDFFRADQEILLRSYHLKRKNFGFYRTRADRPQLERLLEDEKRFDFKAKAKHADRLLFTRQDYREFPDLWTADLDFADAQRVTDVNPQISEFAWGTSELVEWNSADGIPLQGVLIRPGNYKPGQRYPVLVYFYRFFSQRLHDFNQMAVNHRPNFPFYAGNGYAIFLPDIRFEIGRPGLSAVKCLVPGVQKLIDMGIADPKAIGLHGHSWSGYQAAYVITQTDIFAAAAAGAPVSNMTSAYSGIRLGTGLARQFQYERTQSRIGGSLFDYPERYIANSPIFQAEYVKTPLLIEFGDEDEAVPWQQGIELYLALRRLEKPTVFLQYRGEPHHLKKYPNKVDYTLKMKAFFDHFLKGAPAPRWWSEGVPYQGK